MARAEQLIEKQERAASDALPGEEKVQRRIGKAFAAFDRALESRVGPEASTSERVHGPARVPL